MIKVKVVGKVTSGKVLIDGLGVGDVGNIVLRDRRQLSQDGILIVVVTMDKEGRFIAAGPDIVSRGFVYVRESEALMEEAKERVTSAIEHCLDNDITEWSVIKMTFVKLLVDIFMKNTSSSNDFTNHHGSVKIIAKFKEKNIYSSLFCYESKLG